MIVFIFIPVSRRILKEIESYNEGDSMTHSYCDKNTGGFIPQTLPTAMPTLKPTTKLTTTTLPPTTTTPPTIPTVYQVRTTTTTVATTTTMITTTPSEQILVTSEAPTTPYVSPAVTNDASRSTTIRAGE